MDIIPEQFAFGHPGDAESPKGKGLQPEGRFKVGKTGVFQENLKDQYQSDTG